MQDDERDAPPPPEPAAAAPSASQSRAEAYRARFHRAKALSAQVARAKAAGGKPTEDEAARLIAEFHARGGRVTICPEPDDNAALGDLRDGARPAKRSAP